jgi:hypothetical protein
VRGASESGGALAHPNGFVEDIEYRDPCRDGEPF